MKIQMNKKGGNVANKKLRDKMMTSKIMISIQQSLKIIKDKYRLLIPIVNSKLKQCMKIMKPMLLQAYEYILLKFKHCIRYILSINKETIRGWFSPHPKRPMTRNEVLLKSGKIALASAMIMSSCFIRKTEAQAATRALLSTLQSGKSTSGDIFIGGNYIELGISSLGSFGSLASAPSYFHNNRIYLPATARSQIGMIANEKGWFSGLRSTTVDFFMPGIIDESWTVGINGNNVAIASAAANNGHTRNQNLDSGFKTVELKNDKNEIIGARTTGTMYDGKVKITQDILLGVNEKLYTTKVKLENISGNDLTDVRYMRAFDPDQNNGMGSAHTHNHVENTDESAKITSYGKVNQAPFIFYALDSRATAGYARDGSREVFYFTDIYNKSGYMQTKNTNGLDGPTNYMDGDIFLKFDLGTLKASASTELTYYSSLDADFKVATDKVDGKVVEDIITDKLPSVDKVEEVINKDTIKDEKPVVDEAKDRFDSLTDTGKDAVSDEAKDKLEAAVDAVDKVIKDDYLKPVIDAIDKLPDSSSDITTKEDLDNLQAAQDAKDKYDDLVNKEDKDEWLSGDKFETGDDYKEVVDAFEKLEGITKDETVNPPSGGTITTHKVTINVTGEKTETKEVGVINGKAYRYQVPLDANERLELVSGNASIEGANTVLLSNVTSTQTIEVKVVNIIKDNLLANLAKVLDEVIVTPGTIDTLKYLKENATIDGSVITVTIPTITSDGLLNLTGTTIKITGIHKSQEDKNESFKIELSQGGQTISKEVDVVFKGDKEAPVVTKTTSQEDLDKQETSKILSFTISDVGVGIDESTLKVTSYDDPSTPIVTNKQLDGSYKFTIDKSSGYEITVADFAGNETTETYIVTSIDKEAPIIEGVSDGSDYFLKHRVKITDQNLKSVTINGEVIDSTSFVMGTYTFDRDAEGSYEVIASDGANTSKVTFSIKAVPGDPSEKNAAIKIMRSELKDQEALLTTEEYETLSVTINGLEGSINADVVKGFEEAYDKIKDNTVTYETRAVFDELLVEVNDGSKYYGTLTDDIATRRQAIIVAINDKLKPLRDEQAKVDTLKKELDKYDPVQLKNTDQGIIQNKLTDLGKVDTTLIKDGETNQTLVAAKASATELLKVFAAYSDEVAKLGSELNGITGDNVKSSDSDLINKVIKDLEAYKASNSNKITPADAEIITDKINAAKGLIAQINKVATTISTNTAIIQSMTVESVNKENIGNVKTAYDLINTFVANMTPDEKTKLEELAKYIVALENKVELDAVANIDDDIKTLTISDVTEGSRTTIDTVIAKINEVLAKEGTTENQKTLLNNKKANAEGLIAQLNTVKNAVDNAVKAYDGFGINTVKSSDKDPINQAGATVNKVLTDYDKNLTEPQRTALTSALSKATGLIARIDEVAGIIGEISALAGLNDDTLKITDKDKIELVLGYQTGIANNLTEDEKSTVEGYVTAINTLKDTLNNVKIYLDKLDTYSTITADKITADVITNINELLKEDKYDKYLTEELISISKNQKEKMSGLIAGIDGAKVAIEEIASTLGIITNENVNTTNKAAVEAAKALLDKFPYPENSLTEAQKEKIVSLKKTVEECLTKIKEVEDGLVSIEESLSLITEETVKTTDETKLAEIKTKIETFITSFGANLTDSQKSALNSQLTTISRLQNLIIIANDAYQNAIKNIIESASVDNINADDLNKVNNVLGFIDTALENKALSEEQINKLTEVKGTYDGLKERIDLVNEKVEEIESQLKDIDETNVTKDTKKDMDQLQSLIDSLKTLYPNNLSGEQTTIIDNQTEKLASLNTKIKEIEAKIVELKGKLDAYELASVKFENKEELSALKAEIEASIESLAGNLTEEQKTTLDGYKDTVTSFIDRIEEVESKIVEFETALEEIGVDDTTVTSGHRNELGTLKDAMNQFLTDFADNINASQVTIIKGKEEEIDALVSKIDKVKEEMDKISKVIKDFTVENVKETDKDKLDEIKDLITEVESKYETNLTDTEKGSLTGQTEDVKELEERIEEVKKEVENIAGAMDSVKPENVTNDDKDEIKDLKDKIDSFDKVYGENITEEQGNTIQGQVDKIKDLEEVIQKVEDTLKEIEDSLSSLTTENVKETDKDALKELQDKIDVVMKDLENNLSTSDKETIKDYTQDIVELDKKIEDVLGAIKDIETALPDLNTDNVTGDDKKDVTDLKDKIDSFDKVYGDNITEEQGNIIQGQVDKVKDLEEVIQKVEDTLKEIEDSLSSLTTENVKESDKEALKELQDKIDVVMKDLENNLSTSDKETIKDYTQDIVELDKKIEEVLGAIEEIETALPDVNKDNVVLDDKKDVNDLKDKIEDLNQNYGNNLTEDNKTVVDSKQEQVTELVDRIEVIEEVIKQIEELKKADLTQPENIQKIKDLIGTLGSLSDKQKELLSVKDVEYLEDVVSNGVVTEIEDNLGAVRGEEGTVFIKGTKVEVKDVFETLDKELNDVVQKDIDNKYQDYELVALYDVKLVYKDTYVQPDGKIKVVLELPADYLQYEDIQAVYVDDNGNVTVYPFEIIDGYIHIETDHLSYYGIIAKGKLTSEQPTPEQPKQPDSSKEEDVTDTSDHTMIDMYAVLGMLSVAGYLALKDRKYLNR